MSGAPQMGCAEAEAIAPDLALGISSGPERAAGLAHAESCETCRRLVAELAAVADALLLLAPEDEPSAGFEGRVSERLAPNARTRRQDRAGGRGRAGRRGRAPRRPLVALLGVAAGILVVVASLGAGGLIARRADRRSQALTHEYVAALQALGGRSLRAAALRDPSGRQIGQAFVYDGSPSWVFVSIDRGGTDGEYVVQLTGPSAGPVVFTPLHLADGHGALGRTANGDVRGLTDLAIIDPGGQVRYRTTVPPADDGR